MLDKLKGLMQLKDKMQEVKKELDALEINIESDDKTLTITVSGSQEIRAVKFASHPRNLDQSKMETLLKEAVNKALKESQKLAAQRMCSLTGINLPGL